MTAVFPFIGSYGYSFKRHMSQFLRELEDGTYRRYRRSTVIQKSCNLQVKDVRRTTRDAINTMWEAAQNTAAIGTYEFYFYSPEEVDISGFDILGISATGRYKAIFLDPDLVWTRTGSCRWSTALNIKIVGT